MMYDIRLKKLLLPIDGYDYVVETWRSVDGEPFAFCGEQKMFEYKYQASDYKKELEIKYHVVKYMFRCMDAFIDGRTFTGFKDDDDAIKFGADHEADVYRIETGKGQTLIYEPKFC